ncbi:MAG TPA: electron transfer flavoprotein subunit beta [Bacteroidetes bacterium]|nr:electron transfer flavoprotein subunit beta [Bacteroidota bacterium]
MNILVAASRVPDTTTKILIGNDGKSIDNNNVKFILNPYDEYALEEALQIREKNSGRVVAITVGPTENQETLRNALAMGADDAVHIKSKDENFDSFFVAKNIANYAKSFNPDLILMGKQSIDFDSLQVPSILAELLDLPVITIVTKLNLDNTKVIAEREVEGGKEIVESSLPCIISAQKGLNDPRYPKLPDIMKAKKKTIEEIPAQAYDNKVEVISMELPLRQRLNKIFNASDDEIKEVVRLLHEESKLI